jgi:peptidyl-dipeptidase Dcp
VRSAPVYAKGVKLYECVDEDNTHLGVLYLDFFPRAGKRGGAWCGTYRGQSYKDGQRVAPVVTIVTNFTPPSGELPALLTSDEVETFFHEFGHALHNLFRNVQYKGIASVPRDFVELPSQIMEHWAFHPMVLPLYAKHYLTGEVIPDELVRKIELSDKYGQGFKTTEYLAACYLDMDYHTDRSRFEKSDPAVPEAADLSAETGIAGGAALDVTGFEKTSMNRIGLIPQIPPRYRSTYFQHTMTGGYTAGYYSYIWAEVLDADAFSAFEETGDVFNPELANRFRKYILEPGGSKDAMQMYKDFRGREPDINALLKYRGLN